MPSETPRVSIPDPYEDLSKRSDRLFYLVIGAMLIGFLSLLFMVAGIVIDSWRFSSSAYKESKQLEMQERLIENTINIQKDLVTSVKEIEKTVQELKRP